MIRALLLLTLACKPSDSAPRETTTEGRQPGECIDGADNDGDGVYDCADSDCEGSPDCTSTTTASSTGGTGATPTTLPTSPTTGTSAPDPDLDAAWEALLDKIEGELDHEGVAGMAVAVVVDGQLRYATGVGTNQYGGSIPVTAQTLWRWNSVSKMHTATALLGLAEDGDIDLDAPITDLVPDLALVDGEPDDLTLRHLMTHTAALPDQYWTSCEEDLEARWSVHTPRPWAPPGSFYNYSNDGWSLAGRALEAATGLDYRTAMQLLVIGPSAMTSATFDPVVAMDAGPYAIGYDGYGFYTPENWICRFNEPAGGLYASVEDLARTLEIHLADGGELLSPASVAAMRSQVATQFPARDTAGLGQFSSTWRGLEIVSHDGGGAGFRSEWVIVPSRNFGVAVASNVSWAEPWDVTNEAMDLFLDLSADTEPERLDTDPSTWTRYEGTYVDPVYTGAIDIWLDDREQLYMTLHDYKGTVYRLYQAGDDTFFYAIDGWFTTMRFLADEDGTTRWFANRYWVATRSDGAAAAPPTASPEERDAVWRQARESTPPATGRRAWDDDGAG